MVLSLNGKSTKGDKGPHEWASGEDQQFFFKTLRKSKLTVMGGNSYRIAQSDIKLNPKQLKIVLTRNPEKYIKHQVAGQLEFSDESPLKLVKRLEKKGYKEMLLISGENLNYEFMKSNLITDLWLTIEPKILGKGRGLVAEGDFDIKLKLESIEKLNKRGTLLLKYSL